MANPFTILGPEFYSVLLPFIFTFAIVYGILYYVGGPFQKQKNIAGALAFVMAAFVTGIAGPQLASFFINLSGITSMILAGILVVILFLAMIGMDDKLKWIGTAVFLTLLGIAVWFVSAGNIVGISLDAQTTTLIFWGAILLLVIWFIVKGEGGAAAPAAGRT